MLYNASEHYLIDLRNDSHSSNCFAYQIYAKRKIGCEIR